MFLFARYPINSIKNITLMFTWKFIYNSKFSGCPLSGRPYMLAYEGLVAVIIHMSILISLIAKNIMSILNEELQKE